MLKVVDKKGEESRVIVSRPLADPRKNSKAVGMALQGVGESDAAGQAKTGLVGSLLVIKCNIKMSSHA